MGAYLIGVLLFALGIAITIALHEAGHMLTARAFGMRVRRFFVGFGPKLWSVKKGHTEYGVAAVPFGGYCEIAGMTALDEVTEEEAPHAMRTRPAWQRILVLSGGVIVNFALGLSIIYGVAVASGIPDPDTTPVVGETVCSADQNPDGTLAECVGAGPAAAAGVRPGDRILALDGEPVVDFLDLRDRVQARPGDTVVLSVERDGDVRKVAVELETVIRYTESGETVEAGSVGLQSASTVRKFGPLEAVPATFAYTGELLRATARGVIELPLKIPSVAAAIFGAERDPEGPMSVVGASRVGGELVEARLWPAFFMMLASLNFFLGLFNLVPLPPLDGGHIAVVIYERIRDFFRRLRGLAPGGPANYERLMPLTMTMVFMLMTVGGLVLVADVVNPVRLFGG
ncbi:M50 family metallopeptidase [Corynebacterium guangdongense]|uniref:Zinc metalloprotease Rip1 n=1 Tax=Corynebacterium guangdongense TaxID=1783348 RepID=A0ABU1ZXD2_9CORY|nr:M50 family metallopeptidase [Corynebacterium guangdongense]MDR7329589.1 membrane-associated protease RseP (regulator of RpoE activity) [Corynebacterium guangdongense]WJZ18154.1 Zinc metalloprotease Rip1 [Corynebacterium guangdongense]